MDLAAPATSAPFGGALRLNDVPYLVRRYNEEMEAGEKAQASGAKIAHFELAYRYALQARDSRSNIQL